MVSKNKVTPLTLSQALQQAVALQNQGKLDRAIRIYKSILRTIPDEFDTLHFLGLACAQKQRFKDAEKYLRAAIASDPQSFEALTNLGNVFQARNQRLDAIEFYNRAIALDPTHAEAHYNLGIAHAALNQHESALACFEKARSLASDDGPRTLLNMGLSLQALGRTKESVSVYNQVIDLAPDYAEAHNNLGSALAALRNDDGALASYQRALALRPDFAEAHCNLGLLLSAQGKHDAAVASYERAIALEPGYLQAHNNLLSLLAELGRYEQVITKCEDALEHHVDDPGFLSSIVGAKRQICDWRKLPKLERTLIQNTEKSNGAIDPFLMLLVTDTPALQQMVARQRSKKLERGEMRATQKHKSREKIRVAYLSADFRAHPMSFLMAGVIEKHDRRGFEIFGISYGPDDDSDMRRRMAAAFDKFIDVRRQGDEETLALLRNLDLDIAVDLAGHTRFSRLHLLSTRPARVQVHYAGTPGTVGAKFIDYAIADRYVVPKASVEMFTERLAYLPGSYVPTSYNDRSVAKPMSRAECGLPENAFVFSSFCNSNKISPDVFNIWMRLVLATEDSVLWLLGGGFKHEDNLRNEATARGVDPSRIIFAPRLENAEHLARLIQADLHLDTFPCGGHTTTSDALWMGLPTVTCPGQSFASRVAGSMLHDLSLPELVADNFEEYEALALHLAQDQSALQELKDALLAKRKTAPLFDPKQCAQKLEGLYKKMYDLHVEGRPPEMINGSNVEP